MRIKHTFTCSIWSKYRNDDSLLYYFPDRFKKTTPPKKYFWQVIALTKPKEYLEYMESALKRIVTIRKMVRSTLKITDEALDVLQGFKENELRLLSKLISTKARKS